MKVIIDPRSNYVYSSYYVYGLTQIAGKQNIAYDISPFRNLEALGNDMRFVITQNNNEIKFFIHTNDSYRILENEYQWCDVYGCVNANYECYSKEEYPKLVSLAPSFGIRAESSLLKILIDASEHLCSIWTDVWNNKVWNKYTAQEECNHIKNLRHYFASRYNLWKNRLPLLAYDNIAVSSDNYVFFLSTLWYNDEHNKNDEGVNLRRASFIRACKSVSECHFEGGLLGNDLSSNQLFADVITYHRETFSSWIEKTKRSAFVFNTPAFWDCHGWKLGEYLALGKCIISTPLSNDLPYPLEHGVSIHFVEGSEESIKQAIEYIIAHPDYRHKLERGARAYWEKYGTPEASLKLLGIK